MISPQRVESRIEELSKISESDGDGVTRRALTKEDKAALELVSSWMKEAGMNVHLDAAGNLIGRTNGEYRHKQPIVLGSHIDSVENGGKYDGAIGVIGGIEVVQHMKDEELPLTRPVEVIAFSEEEGSRFKSGGLFGSLAMIGSVSRQDLDVVDEQGITRGEALTDLGLHTDDIFTEKVIRDKEDILLYLEMHIEQGPVLQENKAPVGIVSHITGITVCDVIVRGRADHAGTTPMHMRQDALSGACELKLALEKILREYEPTAVGTVGVMDIQPGGVNIVPEEVTMTMDIRDVKEESRKNILNLLADEAKEIRNRRGLDIQFVEKSNVTQANCSKEIMAVAKEEAEKMGIEYVELVSGAGHDAQSMAELCDMGMIFVRSEFGSHNPQEYAAIEDIVLGTELLYHVSSHYVL